MEIKFKKLDERAIVPTRGSDKAAGFDLYACLDYPITIEPGESKIISTGLAIAAPKNTFGAVFARSGMAFKRGLRPANAVGVCDEDYRGAYMVALYNDSRSRQIVYDGDRIAQLVFIPYISGEFVEVENLDDTSRGSGGFGSTGDK